MEKNMWIQPLATVQKFVANEYIAACWGVSCDSTEKESASVYHRSNYCGDPNHYQITLDDNGVPISMVEVQTDTLGDLPCTVFTDSSYTNVRDISSIEKGDYIYWTTSASINKKNCTWHHHGTVSTTTNHS